MTTRAPRSCSARAVAAPMPAVAPVTTATAPSRETRAPRSPGMSVAAMRTSVSSLCRLGLRRDHDGRRGGNGPEHTVEERARHREVEERQMQEEDGDGGDREGDDQLNRPRQALPPDQRRLEPPADAVGEPSERVLDPAEGCANDVHRAPAPARMPSAPRPPTTVRARC